LVLLDKTFKEPLLMIYLGHKDKPAQPLFAMTRSVVQMFNKVTDGNQELVHGRYVMSAEKDRKRRTHARTVYDWFEHVTYTGGVGVFANEERYCWDLEPPPLAQPADLRDVMQAAPLNEELSTTVFTNVSWSAN
jgi:hypothetical protein